MQSVEHTRFFDLPYPIDQLFPLFSPEGERKWVPGWDYVNVSNAFPLCEDGIFLTKNHDHADTDAIWLVKKFDATNHFVQFYKVEPDQKIGLITVSCTPLGDSNSFMQTRTTVSYHYFALSGRGVDFIRDFDEAAYVSFIDEWRDLLIQYFENKEII